MAPKRITKTGTLTNIVTKRVNVKVAQPVLDLAKRKAENSPSKDSVTMKRSAFGDLTNAAVNVLQNKSRKPSVTEVKKVTVHAKELPAIKAITTKKANLVTVPSKPAKPVENTFSKQTNLNVPSKPKTRLSDHHNSSDESLYTSALEDVNDSVKLAKNKTRCKSQENKENCRETQSSKKVISRPRGHVARTVPNGVTDFDRENWNDVYQVSEYAMDIFEYLKSREDRFQINEYMSKQVHITGRMRALLVDWMVEIQESFELNHETLYLGVKLTDMVLSKMSLTKEMLQLVGATAMFVASKYDERLPPLVEDFLYVCDGAYRQRDLVRMELKIIKLCGFDLGIPLSYRFLRRYARCNKISMELLTLARFILELSLMDHLAIPIRGSILAAAALWIALKMCGSDWNITLEYYSGYTVKDFHSAALILNRNLHEEPKENLMTIRNKYSHKVFHEVAKIPLISDDALAILDK